MTRKRQASEIAQKINKKVMKKAHRENYSDVNISDSESDDLAQIEREVQDYIYNEGPGGQALRNSLIIEKISGFLDDKDICQWYDSTHTFRKVIDQMDDVIWKRRTQTLAKALRMSIPLQKKYPGKSFREIFPILKSEVENLVSQIRGSRRSLSLGMEVITTAASLVHYRQFGPPSLILRLHNLDLSKVKVPDNHLCSLVSNVYGRVSIKAVTGCNMVRIIDSVKSVTLNIVSQSLDREITEAVVRAMDTRILSVELESVTLDTRALSNYDGKGNCESIQVLAGHEDRQWLRDWARERHWRVTRDSELLIRVVRYYL